ncbi:hypothetical protein F1C15_08265 [Frigoribacterium sp. NBH87]|uniref:hypothetical protein n=1 Tax=Frigoribacterium sp. NBH87 TaxID=2596916 RepID=UPI0016287B77|nr:hypothetical protein [Frigoribacterium sp. NBH87]QNE43796.1 hypothetical protein F1C15_08265 [Frigoribacterium sp. NBH87]
MRTATPRAARLAAVIGVPLALVASGLVVSNASYSAFSAQTSNPTSNWTTGSVKLTDNDADVALFSAVNLKPGSTGTNCITVTSTGSLPSTVKLYGTGAVNVSSDLGLKTTLKIEQGTGTCQAFVAAGTGGTVYDGTLAAFQTARSSYANGADAWVTTGNPTGADATAENRLYKFTYTVASDLLNTSQGVNVKQGFTWEAQNN